MVNMNFKTQSYPSVITHLFLCEKFYIYTTVKGGSFQKFMVESNIVKVLVGRSEKTSVRLLELFFIDFT